MVSRRTCKPPIRRMPGVWPWKSSETPPPPPFGSILFSALSWPWPCFPICPAPGAPTVCKLPRQPGCQFRTHVLSCVGCVAVSNVLICLLSAQSGGTHWGQPFLAGVLSGDLPAVFLSGYLLLYALRLAPGHGCGLRRGELRGHLLPYSGGHHVQHLFTPAIKTTVLSMGRNHIVVWLTPVLRLHQDL